MCENGQEKIQSILLDVANRIEGSRHGFDYGEMDAETAYVTMCETVARSLRAAVRELSASQ